MLSAISSASSWSSFSLSPVRRGEGARRATVCQRISGFLIFALMVMLAGCTVHPSGEDAERNAAMTAARPFTQPAEREIPLLPQNPTADDLVHHALLTNAELEQRYWEWRSAIEQIPQDGTQPTNLVLSANIGFSRGSNSLDKTLLGIGNDPMADIVLPPKLSVAAQRASENARAAGLRFRKAQYSIRSKVLNAWCDYSLTAELIRLEQQNLQLLKTAATVVEARNRAGAAGQQDLLRARNDIDLSQNTLENLRAQLPGQRAMLNALLSRPPEAPLPVPDALPQPAAPPENVNELLAQAAHRNPELAALERETQARQDSIALAKLEYLPDFSISAASDLKGIAQSLAGTVTVPLLRHEAIDAAVAQAQANLHATRAMRRQASQDLGAQLVSDTYALHDAERQLKVLEQTILPRARQSVTLARTAYEASRATFLDLVENQRALISIERLVADLRIARARRLADVEMAAAIGLDQ